MSLAIMAMLLVGLGSTILLASKALPSAEGITYKLIQASEIADQITTELQQAQYLAERTDNAITFTVADRNGDGSPERIRYAWSGTAGDPLIRQYNGGTEVQILDGVQQFDLAYDLAAVTEQYPGADVESPEALLSSYTGAVTPKDFSIDQNNWIGQYFVPALPPDAVSWRVTRARWQARSHATATGEVLVQLRAPDANNLPSTTVLAEQMMYESDLTSGYTWQEHTFDLGGLTPADGLCLVLAGSSGPGTLAQIQYDDAQGPGRLTTTDAGSSWNYDSGKAMLHYVYGKWTAPGTPQTATRQYVTSIRLTLQTGTDLDTRLVTAARTLNIPERLSAVWKLDFDTDPTVLDMNGDGNGDWVVRGGGTFNAGSLSDGVWYADAPLDTYPDHDFAELTTVEVRFRSTSVGSTGPAFWINADWSGSACAPIIASVELQADATQTLTVYHMLAHPTKTPLVTVPGLTSDFVDLRLLIDPDLNTVNVRVNGEDQGTYNYQMVTLSQDDRFATVMPQGGGAEFDSVSIRVGGNFP